MRLADVAHLVIHHCGQWCRAYAVCSFLLALSYSGGMALVYSALGVAAGLAGEGLAAYFQIPAVLLTFGLMLVAFSLSMFGAFELRLPASMLSGLTQASQRLQGGRFVGVFLMGALSALLVSPCVSGVLASALLYISRSHDVLLGGTALFAMACGMSVPLLLLGLSQVRRCRRLGLVMVILFRHAVAWCGALDHAAGFAHCGIAGFAGCLVGGHGSHVGPLSAASCCAQTAYLAA
ncbi:cytochrome c biogenesis protein CcdA [Roseateles sp. GG27B]